MLILAILTISYLFWKTSVTKSINIFWSNELFLIILQMILAVSAIIIKLEAGVGNRTVPMLIVEAAFDGTVKDWSSAVS